MKQKHLAKLENCSQDGALQYLVLREDKKVWRTYLLHVHYETPHHSVQNMKLLARIPKNTLNFHQSSQSEFSDLDSLYRILLQHGTEELRLLTKLRNRDKKPFACILGRFNYDLSAGRPYSDLALEFESVPKTASTS